MSTKEHGNSAAIVELENLNFPNKIKGKKMHCFGQRIFQRHAGMHSFFARKGKKQKCSFSFFFDEKFLFYQNFRCHFRHLKLNFIFFLFLLSFYSCLKALESQNKNFFSQFSFFSCQCLAVFKQKNKFCNRFLLCCFFCSTQQQKSFNTNLNLARLILPDIR